MQVWDLKDLGLQASQRIAQASHPLRLLTHISQNFPTLAASLSRLPVNASLAAEVRSNQRSLPAGGLNALPSVLSCGVCLVSRFCSLVLLCLAFCVLWLARKQKQYKDCSAGPSVGSTIAWQMAA